MASSVLCHCHPSIDVEPQLECASDGINRPSNTSTAPLPRPPERTPPPQRATLSPLHSSSCLPVSKRPLLLHYLPFFPRIKMKFFPVVAAASLALASVYAADTTTTTTDSTVCDLTKLTPLLTDSDLTTCSTSSGLAFPPASAPTADVLKKVCAVPECASLLKKVAALNLGDCTLGALKLNSQLIKPATEACAKAATATTTNTTAAANSTTANATTTAPPATTALPSTTTVTTAPVTVNGEVASSGSGSAESSEDSNNASSVTATTVPSPSATTGSAASLTMAAAGSVVLAVMAALL